MEKVSKVEGITVCFPEVNIDTDAIIPAAWQRSLKTNPGEGLFGGRRYMLNGKEDLDFVLNREPFRKSEIIVAGANFGCGSSREFAVWALMRFGIRAILAPSFGDIFYENSFKNGLLLIMLSEDVIENLYDQLRDTAIPKLLVDLESCTIATPSGKNISFQISSTRRAALLEGLDEIGQTLKYSTDIDAFQAAQKVKEPWVYARPAWH